MKAGERAFAPGVGWLRVGNVEAVDLRALDDADARADGFASMAEMTAALTAMYPDHAKDGKQWWLVEFACESSEPPSRTNGSQAKTPARKRPR